MTYSDDLDAWTNMPCDVPNVIRTFSDEEMVLAADEAEVRAEAASDRQADRLRAAGLF